MASGAGLNRWGLNGGVPLLTVNPSATAVALPGHGTIGTNDSGAFVTPIGMQTFSFMCVQKGATPPSGYTISILGTIDPIAYQVYTNNGANDGVLSVTGTSGPNFNVTFTIPDTSWGLIPGPSEQSGTGQSANPITQTGVFFQAKIALVAVRAVLTAVNNPAGSLTVLGFAVP